MVQVQELSNLNEGVGGTFSTITGNRRRQQDEYTLARLGKQQVLKVRFSTYNTHL